MSSILAPSAASLRRPGIFYHATRTSDVASLCANGADASLVGKNAGSVVGVGFYVSHVYYDAEYWADKLFTCATTILQVRLPSARIATPAEQKAFSPLLTEWGIRQGYMVSGDHGYESTEKLHAAHHVTKQQIEEGHIQALGMASTLMGLYLSEQGYDGYEVEDGAVITAFSLLRGDIFSLAASPHHK
jgi:hypothetical protein